MEDSGIIDLFFQRSETAIENTSKKYGFYLSSIAYRILNSLEDSITRNLSLDRLQYYAAEKRNAETVAILVELEACLPDPHGSAEAALEESELTEILNRFLGELEPLTCCVFLSRYYYAHTVKEVAAQFDLSEGKTKYLLTKARSALKSRLMEEGITV